MVDVDLACSVVIPAYNAAVELPEQLHALASQTTNASFEVLVADNGSTDETGTVAESWRKRLPHVRVVDAGRRRGRSAARNDGIRAASTDLILLCDADDVVASDWVDHLLVALRSHSFVGGALDLLMLNGPAARSLGPLADRTSELPELWGRRYAFSSNLAMHRSVFERAGGFDETYLSSCEEIAFAWRALEAGHKPVFAPGAVVNYRLRPEAHGSLKRQFDSGFGTAQLYADFTPQGVPTRRWHRRIRHELLLLRQAPLTGGRAALGSWLARLAFEAGMARGAIHYRSPMP